jgi:putative addiction module antidote
MYRLKLRRVGNSLGFTIPAEATRRLHVREGDSVYLTESADGFRLTAYDPEFAPAMEAAEGFVARYRNALRKLAE